ncbi:MAG: HesA/MoeB/ThiF family protein [Rikenellaceae bacterium]|nr:HesA/MoeB/ThiF family protein [Rikenellaceae bacterium]
MIRNKKRYERNMIVPEFGMEGQEKLFTSKVLVVGAGGLGSAVLSYLAASGIGTIGIVEFDSVDITNLQRQVLYSFRDVDSSKIDTALDKLSNQNPEINFELYPVRLSEENINLIIEKFDVVVDCTDNYKTRYIIDESCENYGIPMVYGTAQGFTGQISVFDYKDGNSYRNLYPCEDLEKDKETVGVISPVPGIIGSMQAMEVIKLLTGMGESLTGKLVTADWYTMDIKIFNIK